MRVVVFITEDGNAAQAPRGCWEGEAPEAQHRWVCCLPCSKAVPSRPQPSWGERRSPRRRSPAEFSRPRRRSTDAPTLDVGARPRSLSFAPGRRDPVAAVGQASDHSRSSRSRNSSRHSSQAAAARPSRSCASHSESWRPISMLVARPHSARVRSLLRCWHRPPSRAYSHRSGSTDVTTPMAASWTTYPSPSRYARANRRILAIGLMAGAELRDTPSSWTEAIARTLQLSLHQRLLSDFERLRTRAAWSSSARPHRPMQHGTWIPSTWNVDRTVTSRDHQAARKKG